MHQHWHLSQKQQRSYINKTAQTLDVVGWSCGAYMCLQAIINLPPSMYSLVQLWHVDINLVSAWQVYVMVAQV